MKKIVLTLAGLVFVMVTACHSTTEQASEKTSGNSRDTTASFATGEVELVPGAYPAGISEYYKKHYPNESYKVWAYRDTAKSKARYYTKRNNEQLHFDREGKLVNGIQEGKGESHSITVDNQ
jgi:hypothetical protein